MPFKSTAQRAYMYANMPAMAAKWQAHTPKGAKLPTHVNALSTAMANARKKKKSK